MAASLEKFSKGDIVIVPFPYSDLSSSKKRPALVVALSGSRDLVVCGISSKSHPNELQIELEDKDFKFGSLDLSPCYIQPSVLATLDPVIIRKKVGFLRDVKVDEVIEAIVGIFQQQPVIQAPSKALARGKKPSLEN